MSRLRYTSSSQYVSFAILFDFYCNRHHHHHPLLTSRKISTSSEANNLVRGSRQPSCNAFSPIDFDQHRPLRAAAAC